MSVDTAITNSPRLTVERLFSDPPLTQGSPAQLKLTPNGSVTYLQAAQDDRERLDLWIIEAGQHRVYVDARDIVQTNSDVTELTAAERAERERRRQFSHGITQYSWHPDQHHLLIPMDGQVFLVDPKNPTNSQALCPTNTRQSGATLSPNGNWLSYVRAGDLYVTPVNQDQAGETALTDDASETISNGLPDFLAAEEMHRFEGHWWSACERYIAYTKTDEACVEPSQRLELDADGARTITQRYPYPGKANPQVSLYLWDQSSQTSQKLWESSAETPYLARVNWLHNKLIVQVQDRLQQTLTFQAYCPEASTWNTWHEVTSDTWVNLTDDLRALPNDELLISMEVEGPRQLYAVAAAQAPRALVGPTHINQVLAVSDTDAYACGWDKDATENHLFRIALDGSGYTQLTQQTGWHEITLDLKSATFLDRHSATDAPISVTQYNLDGSILTELYKETFPPTHPYHPYLPSHSHATFGSVTASDGQLLHYRITPPTSAATIESDDGAPVIVYVYGGPGAQKVKQEWSPLLIQLFAHHGFAVLELDNRGSTNRGSQFEAPLYRNMGSIEIEDQSLALEIVQQYEWASNTTIGIFGHSYGGYMTLMCLSQQPAIFKAGVAVAPVCDWQLYDTHYTERFMGLPEDNQSGYQHGNVLTHLSQLESPLLLMHGMADDNVLFTHSTLIMNELQRLGKRFQLMTYPGAKHAMQERHVSIHRFELILEFFKTHLQSS